MHLTSKRRGASFEDWKPLVTVLANGVVAMGQEGQLRSAGPAQLQDARERLDFAPERVLLTALDASDLRSEKDVVMQDVLHHVVAFHHGRVRVRLFLNANTQLPTAVETVDAHPEDTFWSVWGDVRTLLSFQSWSLEAGGLRYPRSWDWERNGQAYHSQVVTAVALNPPMKEGDFALSEDVKKVFEARGAKPFESMPLGRPDAPPVELVEGVLQIPGRWNITLVKQEDGIVVLEGPLTSGYSQRVLEECSKRFPNMKVKAVVSTSDAWPHVGGLREYVARGIPLEVLDINRPLVERLVASPRTMLPDSLAQASRAAKLRVVSKRKVLGSGKNRLELIPARTETGERMLFVWMPEHQLLYTSDLVQRLPDDSFFNVQQVSEAVDVATRETLAVTRAFGMHLGPTEWETLTSAVEKARAPVKTALP
ncbi:hypothetical protein D7V97_05235 [Corallococcus sp. CA053C]|nr:hypothetical protein D7V97_05235 [Corallococcus sp. CA053C]